MLCKNPDMQKITVVRPFGAYICILSEVEKKKIKVMTDRGIQGSKRSS